MNTKTTESITIGEYLKAKKDANKQNSVNNAKSGKKTK